jgi:hypothetical protein
MKKILVLVLVFMFTFALPAFGVLHSVRIAGVGFAIKSEAGDMAALEGALEQFAALHPSAAVGALDIVYHPVSGSYDVFIMYDE